MVGLGDCEGKANQLAELVEENGEEEVLVSEMVAEGMNKMVVWVSTK